MAAAKRSSNTLIIVLGLLMGLVGAALVVVLVRDDDDGSDAGTGISGTVPALFSKRALTRGSSGADLVDAVEVRQVPVITRASDALTSVAELQDRTLTADVGPDQQLRSSLFRQRTVRGPLTVPQGKQAVAISVGFTAAGAGYIGPGDKVNLYAIGSRQGGTLAPPCGTGLCPVAPNGPTASVQLVLPNVDVLDVSQQIAPTTATTVPAAGTVARPETGTSVTYLLALDATQAERVILLQRFAELYLTLVPPGQPDAATQGRTQGNVLQP